MNAKMSVFEYHARRNLPVLLAAIILMSAADLLVIRRYITLQSSEIWPLKNWLCVIYFASLLIVYFLLFGPSAKRSNFGLTIGMLRVSEKAFYWMDVLVCVMVFIVIWAVQSGMVSVFTMMYQSQFDYGPQGIYSMLNDPLYKGLMFILPMDMLKYWASALMTVISLGLGLAHAHAALRNSKFPLASVLIAVAFAACVLELAGNSSGFVSSAAAFAVAVTTILLDTWSSSQEVSADEEQ